jgi:hypothetical protein
VNAREAVVDPRVAGPSVVVVAAAADLEAGGGSGRIRAVHPATGPRR